MAYTKATQYTFIEIVHENKFFVQFYLRYNMFVTKKKIQQNICTAQ